MGGIVDAIFGGGPETPAPDPAIGQAALQNSAISKDMSDVAREELAWNRQRYEDIAPTLKAAADKQMRLSDAQIAAAEKAAAQSDAQFAAQVAASNRQMGISEEQMAITRRQAALGEDVSRQGMEIAAKNQSQSDAQWARYQSLFVPIEDQMAKEAIAEGSPGQQEEEASRARAQVASAYEAQKGATARALAANGVNPASGKFEAFQRQAGNAQAADEAGAMNTARTQARLRGIALRSGAAQFGRNMPQTGIAADSLALTGGNASMNAGNNVIAAGNAAAGTAGAAAGTMGASNPSAAAAIYGAAAGTTGTSAQALNAATMARNTGVYSASPWFNSSISGNNSAGNLMLGQFGAQMQGYNAKLQADATLAAGLGQAAGMWWGGGAGAAKGGIIKRKGIKRKGYADGGIVVGPGTETSDSVPAMVDGEKPAALSTGEGVLNAEGVKLVGEDFVHNINRVGIALSKIRQGITINGESRRVNA